MYSQCLDNEHFDIEVFFVKNLKIGSMFKLWYIANKSETDNRKRNEKKSEAKFFTYFFRFIWNRKVWSENMQIHAKFFYFFAKRSENQAKRIVFLFEKRNNEKKEAKRAHPSPDQIIGPWRDGKPLRDSSGEQSFRRIEFVGTETFFKIIAMCCVVSLWYKILKQAVNQRINKYILYMPRVGGWQMKRVCYGEEEVSKRQAYSLTSELTVRGVTQVGSQAGKSTRAWLEDILHWGKWIIGQACRTRWESTRHRGPAWNMHSTRPAGQAVLLTAPQSSSAQSS